MASPSIGMNVIHALLEASGTQIQLNINPPNLETAKLDQLVSGLKEHGVTQASGMAVNSGGKSSKDSNLIG